MKKRLMQVLILVAVTFFGCHGCELEAKEKEEKMKLSSSVFAPDGKIPAKFTCDSDDISPPLKWLDAPSNTETFALIVDDPDAPSKSPFVHWVIYNIPKGTSFLSENILRQEQLSNGARQGLNGAKAMGYKGPCPPSGEHHYHFKLYALDKKLELSGAVGKEELLAAMKGHVLGSAELIGTYSKGH